MKCTLTTVGLVTVAVLSTACVENQEGMNPGGTSPSSLEIKTDLHFNTHLNGADEVPVRDTRAQGQAIFRLDRDGTTMSYRLIAANIDNVHQAHIHMGPATGMGPVVVWLFPNTTGPALVPPANLGPQNGVLATGSFTSANFIGPLAGQPMSALINQLKDANLYVNVHTTDGVAPPDTGPGDFPGGEIRGQLDN